MKQIDLRTPTADTGCEVLVHYDLMLEDGTVADSTRGGSPLRLRLGDGTLIEGLERVVRGMRPGERREVLLAPEQAFGPRLENNLHAMPRVSFPDAEKIVPGQVIGFVTPGGTEVGGTVQSVDEQVVVVDLNHPLAGHRLFFAVELVAVVPRDGTALPAG